jgi:hypothetical protein
VLQQSFKSEGAFTINNNFNNNTVVIDGGNRGPAASGANADPGAKMGAGLVDTQDL